MRWRLLLSYLGLSLFILAVLEIPLGIVNQRNEQSNLESKVEHDAVVIASAADDTLEARQSGSMPGLKVYASDYQRRFGGRVIIVNRKGIALVDSRPPGWSDFASRPEIEVALKGGVASGVRYSQTLREHLLYVAVPVASAVPGASKPMVHGAVRITYPTSAVDARVLRYWLLLLAIAAIVLAVVTVLALRIARSVSRPLNRLETAAARAGAGDLSVRAEATGGPPEVRSLATTFNTMIVELEQLVRAQEEFVADASHELRTPLTALQLRLENLARDVSEGGQADLEAALGEVGRLSRLVEGLLALARAETPPPEQVDLRAVVEERLEALAALASDRGVRLTGDVAGAALVGRDRLGQVLENLLANAIAVAPPGTTVSVRGNEDELHVIDQGPGMSAEQRERAFDRFWRAGSDGRGSGLGLAIVRRLVEIDGGRIELREAAGGGLDAVVRLRPLPSAR
ncbi:MAG: ATP-binding protein [Gaiellaceae bacterium]